MAYAFSHNFFYYRTYNIHGFLKNLCPITNLSNSAIRVQRVHRYLLFAILPDTDKKTVYIIQTMLESLTPDLIGSR